MTLQPPDPEVPPHLTGDDRDFALRVGRAIAAEPFEPDAELDVAEALRRLPDAWASAAIESVDSSPGERWMDEQFIRCRVPQDRRRTILAELFAGDADSGRG